MIHELSYDSALFGVRIGRAAAPLPEPGLLGGEALARDFQCLYFSCDAGDAGAMRAAAACGFTLADIRVELRAPVDVLARLQDRCAGQTAGPLDAAGRAAWRDLLPVGRELAEFSRFAIDPRFGLDAARRLYDDWIRVSCEEQRADPVIVAWQGGRPAGLVTCVPAGDRMNLELVAVLRDHAGAGTGSCLIGLAAKAAAGRGVETMGVVTQGRNVGALAFYQRCGFAIANVGLVYHRWLR